MKLVLLPVPKSIHEKNLYVNMIVRAWSLGLLPSKNIHYCRFSYLRLRFHVKTELAMGMMSSNVTVCYWYDFCVLDVLDVSLACSKMLSNR